MLNISIDFKLTEKVLTTIFLMAFLLLINDKYLWISIIIAGQSHFLLTYFYQYKAGKFKKKIIVLYVLLLSLFFPLGWYLQTHFFAIVAIFFVFHHFYDEMKLANIEITLLRTFYFIPLLLNLILYEFYPHLVHNENKLYYLLIAALPFVMMVKRRDYCLVLFYICSLSLTFCLFLYFNWLNSFHIWVFIILSHYILWYSNMGRLYILKDMILFKTYLIHIFVVNFFIFIFWLLGDDIPYLSILHANFFTPLAYFVWTLMHLTFTLRVKDYSWLALSRNFTR